MLAIQRQDLASNLKVRSHCPSRLNAWIMHKIWVSHDTSAICAFHKFFWHGNCIVVCWCSSDRCFTQFQVLSSWKLLPLSRSSTTFHRWLADIWCMFCACNTYLSLTISERNFIGICIHPVWGLCVPMHIYLWYFSTLPIKTNIVPYQLSRHRTCSYD